MSAAGIDTLDGNFKPLRDSILFTRVDLIGTFEVRDWRIGAHCWDEADALWGVASWGNSLTSRYRSLEQSNIGSVKLGRCHIEINALLVSRHSMLPKDYNEYATPFDLERKSLLAAVPRRRFYDLRPSKPSPSLYVNLHHFE